MKSRITIHGHPLHPMLIPFPFAFLSGAVLFDLLSWATDSVTFWATARHLIAAGIAAGLLAAVPGVVDYLLVVPPRSSGKRRATAHMLSNVGALALFGLAWLIRGDAAGGSRWLVLGIEVAGFLLLSAAGWMGGTLVYRNQIAVDHRYANAGQWAERALEPGDNPRFVPLDASLTEMDVDQMKLLRIHDRRVVLARTEDGCVAFDDRCTHKGGSLADGVMICGTVQCPWHGSQFDAATGHVRSGPAVREIGTYRLRDEDGQVQLDLRS